MDSNQLTNAGTVQKRRSKRPIGRKSTSGSYMEVKEPEIIFESVDPWDFTSLKRFLDSYLSPNGSTDISLFDALKENIDFFQKLKIELKKKYKVFEQSFAQPKPQGRVSHRTLPVTRHMLSRSSSTVSFQERPATSIKKHTSRQKERSSDHQPRQPLTCNSIWNSVHRFFSTVPTVEQFQKYLKPSEEKPVICELGQHYTIAFNQKLRQRYKSDAVLLKVPEHVVSPVGMIGGAPIVSFRRVIAALVTLVNDESEKDVVSISEQSDHSKMQSLEDFEIDDEVDSLNPTILFGTSNYSKLSFEEKLSIEIAALELNPNEDGPCEIDNEIMEEIASLQQEMRKYEESTNSLRSMILKRLENDHEKMVEKAEKIKEWTALIDKVDKENKQKMVRPKSRDKLA